MERIDWIATFTSGAIVGGMATAGSGAIMVAVGAPSIPGVVATMFVAAVAGATALLGAWLK